MVCNLFELNKVRIKFLSIKGLSYMNKTHMHANIVVYHCVRGSMSLCVCVCVHAYLHVSQQE